MVEYIKKRNKDRVSCSIQYLYSVIICQEVFKNDKVKYKRNVNRKIKSPFYSSKNVSLV